MVVDEKIFEIVVENKEHFFVITISWYGENGETTKIKKLCYTLGKHSNDEMVNEVMDSIWGIKNKGEIQ